VVEALPPYCVKPNGGISGNAEVKSRIQK